CLIGKQEPIWHRNPAAPVPLSLFWKRDQMSLLQNPSSPNSYAYGSAIQVMAFVERFRSIQLNRRRIGVD
ncbi:MAG TPA: hypothetical protein VNN06_02720, partial [Ramlibacter sp.]|nr:hypothetical protein [Ramlibacter sp.]